MFAILFLLLPAGAFPHSTGVAVGPPHETSVYFFWRAGCPHCERETEFLQQLAQEEPAVTIRSFDALDPANRPLLHRLRGLLQGEIASVPITIVGKRAWIGYGEHATTGTSIGEAVRLCVEHGCPDVLAELVETSGAVERQAPTIVVAPDVPAAIRLPFVGEIDPASLSLPA